jgi:hypothetical protein
MPLDLSIPRGSLTNVHWLLTVPVPIFLVSQLQLANMALRSSQVHFGDYLIGELSQYAFVVLVGHDTFQILTDRA